MEVAKGDWVVEVTRSLGTEGARPGGVEGSGGGEEELEGEEGREDGEVGEGSEDTVANSETDADAPAADATRSRLPKDADLLPDLFGE